MIPTSSICNLSDIAHAASDRNPVRGLTHTFYQYPARFSPIFARAAIQAFSRPGDLVLDPFIVGGTTIIEAMVLGRRFIGSDINELATFLAEVKVSCLAENERKAIRYWASHIVPDLRCSDNQQHEDTLLRHIPRNLNLPSARGLRKTIAQCIAALDSELTTPAYKQF